MSVIADLIRAGVDPDLVARVAQEMVDCAKGGRVDEQPEPRTKPFTDGRKSIIDWSKATPRPDHASWLKLKAEVFRRDGYVCAYCGEEDTDFTADHIVPLSRGGTNDISNLTACCIPCNNSKRHLLLSEWKGRLTCL